jgi:hypothetical protein
MRKRFALTATAFLALGTAGVANAAVLNWAGTATALFGAFTPAEFRGGGVATINGSSGAVPAHLSALRLAASRGQIQGTELVLVTDPDYYCGSGAMCPVLKYDGIRFMTGTWRGISGGAASTPTGNVGILPVGGTAKYCILSTACTQFIPMLLTQPTTVNGVPGSGTKGVGVGGLITAGGYGGMRSSLQAHPWTIKTATVLDQITPTGGPPPITTTWVAQGWAHAPVSTTTSTAQPSGMVQLVTPSQILTNSTLGSNAKKGSFVILVIRFIPEPGMVLLLCSGVAGLALLGRRRMRQ